jgi:uncharacterized protein (TIGR01777 family)
MRIVIPGGSGQVGRLLSRHFHAEGHAVTVLSRRVFPAAWNVVAWDGKSAGRWAEALAGCDVCINLAGRSVNCRYTPERRKEIYDSRIESTRALGAVMAGMTDPPRLWLNASTATIYRHALVRAMDEATGELGGGEPGAPDTWNFSIKVAKDWEAALFGAVTPRTRKVAMRSAVIMTPDRGGPFALLSKLVRLGLGGANGSGKLFVSCVHAADFVRAVEWLILNEGLEGAVNIASPHPLPNRAFMRELRAAWGQRVGLPATAWMIEAAALVLRTESELVLKSRQVVPGRLLEAGFRFEFPEWRAAARDLVGQWRGAAVHAA